MKKATGPALRQKSRFRSGSAIIASVALVAFGYAAVRIFAASGTASLYLSPAIGTYAPGQAVTVKVYVNTVTDPVNAVQADFSYPTAKFQFNSIDGTGSAFGLDALSTGGNGKISIARGTSGGTAPVSGVQLVSTVHFTALAAGSASLAFLTTSHVVRSTDTADILATSTGATYTIAVATTPTPTPVHTPTPTPAKSATPKPAGSVSPSPTATVVAAGASPSASASPSISASPESTSKVVTVPVTKIPQKTNVLGVKLAGIPVLVLASIAVLVATAGVVFFMAHGGTTSTAADDPVTTSTPPAPTAPTPSETPATPPVQTPAAPSTPAEPSDTTQTAENQEKDS
jgi:hypothetical protein